MASNVSVEKIRQGIQYLEDEFMNPVVSTGEQVMDEYTALNQSLNSEQIATLIRDQQARLESLKSELKQICNNAITSIEQSNSIIKNNQTSIDDELSNV